MKQTSVQKMLGAGLVLSFMAASFAALPVANAAKNLPDGQLIACGMADGDHHGMHGMHEDHHQEHFERMATKLGLSEGQREELEAFHESFREQHADRFEAMRAKHEALKEAIQAHGHDSPEAQAIKEEMKQAHREMRAQMEEKMRAILTPEQYEKFQAIKAEKKARWQQKKQEHLEKKQPEGDQ